MEEEDTLLKLSQILDTLVSQNSPGKERDSNSINALLTSVLTSYQNRYLEPPSTKPNQITESLIVTKIFYALQKMFARNPSLLIENNRYLTILKSTFSFFDCFNCSLEIIDKIIFSLIKICAYSFNSGLLVHNRILSQQRNYILKYLDNILSDIIKSFTNTNSKETEIKQLVPDANNTNTLLMDDFSNYNRSKISKISISIKILQFITHPSILKLLFSQDNISYTIDSYITKCWFCLENIVINIKFTPENTQVIDILDHLYSSLLQTTTIYFLNDDTNQIARLELAVNTYHKILNWSLLNHFTAIPLVLAHSLISISLKLETVGNTEYLWNNIGISDASLYHFLHLIDRIEDHDLKNCLKLLVYAKFMKNNNEVESSKTELETQDNCHLLIKTCPFKYEDITLFKDIELQFKHLRFNYIFFNEKEKIIERTEKLSLETIKLYEENNISSTYNINALSCLELHNLIESLGVYACYLSGSFNVSSQCCKICDVCYPISSYSAKNVDKNRPGTDSNKKVVEIIEVLKQLMVFGMENRDTHVTINVIMALIRVYRNFQPSNDNTGIADPIIWKFIQYSFEHNYREVRMLIVRLIPLFIIRPDDKILNDNLDKILCYIWSFQPNKENLHVFEGCIVLLGELLMVKSVDTRYYILLNHLIKFMSDPDEFRSNLAIFELKIIAATKGVTPWKIVEPFIPLISREIVKNRSSSPGILTNFCFAIEMSQVLFLERTLKFTVPFLVDSYNENHIAFIASVTKKSNADLIRSHLDEILAYLFAKYDNISPQKITKILSIYDKSYANFGLDDLIHFCKGPFFLYNLLYHYNSESSTLERIRSSIGLISKTIKFDENEDIAIEKMLDRWFLIIIQMISTTLNDKKGSNPFTVKVRAIKSIGCLALLYKKYEAYLGQVVSALQLALNYEELRTEALICLKMVIENVDSKNMEYIFDTLLSQSIQLFDEFTEENQKLSTEIILILMKRVPNKDLSYRYALQKIPSFKNISFQHVSDRRLVADFRNRMRSDNKWIIEQVLDDLIEYLTMSKVKYQQLIKDDELLLMTSKSLFDMLLTNSFKFYNSHNNDGSAKDDNSQISIKSAKVFALMGNLEPNNSSNGRQTSKGYDNVTNFLLVTNLQKSKSSDQETNQTLVEFSMFFLKNVLVRSFLSSVNPEEQKYLSFIIQEYLSIFDIPAFSWDRLDDLTKNILTPLKYSRYKQSVKPKKYSFPIYKPTKDYNTWIKELATNTLYNCAAISENIFKSPPQITSICTIIPLLDFNIIRFVIPYAVLFLIVTEPENSNDKKQLYEEFKIVLEHDLHSVNNSVVKEGLKKCIVTILEIFQFLKAWNSKIYEEEDIGRSNNKAHTKLKRTGILRVEKFINLFPANVLAKRCAECDMYEGSILFLEKSYNEDKMEKDVFFTSLKDMYVQLEDYDQLHGVLKTFSTNSLNDKLLEFKYNEDAQVSNESLNAIAQYDLDDIADNFNEKNDERISVINHSATELFEVLNKNCEYDQILLNLKNFKQKTVSNVSTMNSEWLLHGLQAAIYTGLIDDIEEWSYLSQKSPLLSIPGSDLSIYYEIAQALISLKHKKISNCMNHIKSATTYIGLAISNSENIIHRKIPDYMVLLHSLNDFEILANTNTINDNNIQHIKRRLQNSKKDFRSIWKIHSIKSTIYRLHPLKEFQDLYKDSLIESCRILREHRKLPQATKYITKALVLNDKSLDKEMTQSSTLLMNVEFSKLFWAQNNYETALKNMGLVVENLDVKNPYYLEFNLTYLNWLSVSAEGSSDEIMKKYSTLLNVRNFEYSADVFYQYATYLNKLLEAQVPEESDGSIDIMVIKNYILAVRYSEKYVHEVLPKAVTLWLDYHQKYIALESDVTNVSKKIVDLRNNHYLKLNLLVEKCVSELGNKWYIVLSQMISRLTHDDKKITEIISKIIIELTMKYPWILLYSVFSQARSVNNSRRAIGSKILTKLQDSRSSKDAKLPKIIASGLTLLESIMSVCNVNNNFKHSKSGNLVKDLYKDLNFDYPRDAECYSLALPIKSNMDLLYNLRNDIDKRVVFYHRFHEKVKILFSLQQPKRVKVTGTNNMIYYLLFKPKDDLRKDNKVMEFSTVMDGLLGKNYETKSRNMHIKSFAATPLNETTGIIEWVQNFITLRPIIDKQLKRKNKTLNMRNMKAEFGDAKNDDKLNIYNSYIEKYPPVLGEWMIESFPNMSEWFKARSLFTTSLAVMSIVGYLIGIGDRHLDNIMINKNTGMIMHIDFDCIFEKGKSLGVPEIVPFRLTPNLVEAMGVLGYEGSFRKSCELTMSLIRENENILMNFLESFIHDPLMDWRGSSASSSNQNESRMEERNQLRIKRNQERVYKILRRKIRGVLTKDDDNTNYRDSGGLSVSVNLQVELLIQTAVSAENLSKMFFGWMPFL